MTTVRVCEVRPLLVHLSCFSRRSCARQRSPMGAALWYPPWLSLVRCRSFRRPPAVSKRRGDGSSMAERKSAGVLARIAGRRWRDYETPAGRRPVKEFLAQLSDADAAEVVA